MSYRILFSIFIVCNLLFSRVALAEEFEWSAHMQITPASITSSDFELSEPQIRVLLENTGTRAWNSQAEKLFISYHLRDEHGNLIRYDNKRFAVPNLAPSQKISLNLTIPTPDDLPADLHGKRLRLDFDMVREGINWFSQVNPGNHFPEISMIVDEKSLASLRSEAAMQKARDLEVGVKAIDLATSLAFYTVRKAEHTFVMPSGRFTVLTAGAAYPEAWIRDCATGVRAAYLVIGDAAARGCASLHMLRQRNDGYVNDWVDSAGRVDKNTVESDQESSLVIAVSDYIASTKNFAFLNEKIENKPVVEHLERALSYVWLTERDPATGLVKNGHTIDWGDVSIDGSDQSAIYLKHNSHLVVGIYANAMYALAIRDYIDLVSKSVSPDDGNIELWQKRLTVLRHSIVANLWSPERGYFLMHKDLTPVVLPVNENDMFAMGGNAIAIEAGLATPEMAGRIFDVALRMKEKFDAPTISGVLYPPYPDGVYKHPAVTHPFQYQNGGAWDWFGLRLVSDMIKNGRTVDACKSLDEIATKVVRNRTFSEWDAQDGRPMGSKDYLGAAAEYISAIEDLRNYDTRLDRGTKPVRARRNLCASLH